MFSGHYSKRPQSSNEAAIRCYFAWILCGLLLLFCASSHAARYGLQNRNLKLATSQSFLASDEARLEAAIAALLFIGCLAILRVPRFIATGSSTLAAPILCALETREYDRESHLRPPPNTWDNFV